MARKVRRMGTMCLFAINGWMPRSFAGPGHQVLSQPQDKRSRVEKAKELKKKRKGSGSMLHA